MVEGTRPSAANRGPPLGCMPCTHQRVEVVETYSWRTPRLRASVHIDCNPLAARLIVHSRHVHILAGRLLCLSSWRLLPSHPWHPPSSRHSLGASHTRPVAHSHPDRLGAHNLLYNHLCHLVGGHIHLALGGSRLSLYRASLLFLSRPWQDRNTVDLTTGLLMDPGSACQVVGEALGRGCRIDLGVARSHSLVPDLLASSLGRHWKAFLWSMVCARR